MRPIWRVSQLDATFLAPLDDEKRRIESDLLKEKKEPRQLALAKEWSELLDFMKAMAKVARSNDPLGLITEVRDDATSTQSHYRLKVGPWTARTTVIRPRIP